MQEEIKKWLQDMATSLEENIEEKITFRIGECESEYHNKGNGEFTTIKGALFLTTHKGHLFTVRDDKQGITDCFCIFGSNDIIKIDENYFTYIVPKNDKEIYKISLNQIQSDIKNLNYEFIQCSGIWEWENGDTSCTTISKRELALVKGIANRYPFEYEYDPSDFGQDTDSEFRFTVNQFNNSNITEDNYIVADSVASDFKDNLVAMLKKLKEELEFLPPRFREEFLEIICYCKQDAHSVKKNAELFLDNIMDELTEEERKKMFVVIK